MDIKITDLFLSDTWALSGSKATHGENAASETWDSAKARAVDPETADEPLLKIEADCQYFRDYCKGYGAWDDEERASWDASDCNALLLQMIAGDKREGGLDGVAIDDEAAWVEYQAGAEAGQYSGNIYRSGTDVYYNLSN